MGRTGSWRDRHGDRRWYGWYEASGNGFGGQHPIFYGTAEPSPSSSAGHFTLLRKRTLKILFVGVGVVVVLFELELLRKSLPWVCSVVGKTTNSQTRASNISSGSPVCSLSDSWNSTMLSNPVREMSASKHPPLVLMTNVVSLTVLYSCRHGQQGSNAHSSLNPLDI